MRSALALALFPIAGCILDFDIHGSGGDGTGGSTSQGPTTTGMSTSSAGGAGGSSTSTGMPLPCESQGGTCHPVVSGWLGPATLVNEATCSVGLTQALLGGPAATAQACPCEVATSPCRSPILSLHPDDECMVAATDTLLAGSFDMCDPVATNMGPVGLLMNSSQSTVAGSCALVTPTPPPVYNAPTSLCTSPSVCSDPDEACVAPPGPACVWQAGTAMPCPPGYQGTAQTLNVNELQCGVCGAPTGMDCLGNLSFYAGNDASCTGTALTVAISAGCNYIEGVGANFYAQYKPNSIGTCLPASGVVTAPETWTVCCAG